MALKTGAQLYRRNEENEAQCLQVGRTHRRRDHTSRQRHAI
jgi:hypothetical protein